MNIQVAKSAGFCFGVKRALDIAFKTISSDALVEILGDIVHNEDVIRSIKKTGIKKINKLTCGRNKTLLIRAHGASQSTFKKALRLGYKVIDATCPMVKEIHKIAKRMEQKGFQIIIIGDKKHDEVCGIVGQLKKKALVIDRIQHIPVKKIRKIKRAAVVVQSTQNLQMAARIVKILNRLIGNLRFFNTICGPTRKKQAEITSMPLQNDVMIIIGSKNSANTKRLFEISRSLNKRTHWVRSKRDIRPKWFKEAQVAGIASLRVGITAGASTPDSTTQDIIAYIKKLGGASS